ncbi:MAG: response regulator [Actinomycetota bacterium]|nr:response regulator [Actinomycetota bacterium]
MTPVPITPRPATILLAEDSENDAELTRLGFERARLLVDLHHVTDGEQCLAFLRREAPYTDAPTPDLLLLDLNMPRLDGREVLAELVSNERLQHLPVVVLTTSSDESDVLEMYRLRCSSYITKPIDFHQFIDVVRNVGDYWLTMLVLPTPAPAG